MNGAQALIRTLVDCGVDVCFGNPGTSEMHFVAALDTVPQMRGVLALFEGVATGAADGTPGDRQAGGHTAAPGPGVRQRSRTCTTRAGATSRSSTWCGEHATYHKKYDAALETDATPWPARCAGGCAGR